MQGFSYCPIPYKDKLCDGFMQGFMLHGIILLTSDHLMQSPILNGIKILMYQ